MLNSHFGCLDRYLLLSYPHWGYIALLFVRSTYAVQSTRAQCISGSAHMYHGHNIYTRAYLYIPPHLYIDNIFTTTTRVLIIMHHVHSDIPYWIYVCSYSFGLSEVVGDTAIWGAATSSTYHPNGRCCAINVIMFKHEDGGGGIKKKCNSLRYIRLPS